MTSRRVLADTGKVVGAGIISAAAAAACVVSFFLLPAILGVFVEGVLSTFGIVRTALAMIVVSFTSWFLQMSPGSMLLVLVVAGLSYVIVERPFLRLKRRPLVDR